MDSYDNAAGSLQARFLNMFPLEAEDRRRAYSFLRGWTPAFAIACAKFDALLGVNKQGIHWTRIREKFGSPSFAYRMEGQARFAINIHRPADVQRLECSSAQNFDPVAVAIQELVLQTEVELRSLCIICGAASEINNDQGPWASLCDEHRAATFDEDPLGLAGPVWAAARLRDDAR